MITNHSWSLDSTPNESLAFEPSVPGQPSDPCLVHAAPRRLPIFHLLRESWNLTIPRPFRRPYSVTRTRCPSQSHAHSFTLVHTLTRFSTLFLRFPGSDPWQHLVLLPAFFRITTDSFRLFQDRGRLSFRLFQLLSDCFRLFQPLANFFSAARTASLQFEIRHSAFALISLTP